MDLRKRTGTLKLKNEIVKWIALVIVIAGATGFLRRSLFLVRRAWARPKRV